MLERWRTTAAWNAGWCTTPTLRRSPLGRCAPTWISISQFSGPVRPLGNLPGRKRGGRILRVRNNHPSGVWSVRNEAGRAQDRGDLDGHQGHGEDAQERSRRGHQGAPVRLSGSAAAERPIGSVRSRTRSPAGQCALQAPPNPLLPLHRARPSRRSRLAAPRRSVPSAQLPQSPPCRRRRRARTAARVGATERHGDESADQRGRVTRTAARLVRSDRAEPERADVPVPDRDGQDREGGRRQRERRDRRDRQQDDQERQPTGRRSTAGPAAARHSAGPAGARTQQDRQHDRQDRQTARPAGPSDPSGPAEPPDPPGPAEPPGPAGPAGPAAGRRRSAGS